MKFVHCAFSTNNHQEIVNVFNILHRLSKPPWLLLLVVLYFKNPVYSFNTLAFIQTQALFSRLYFPNLEKYLGIRFPRLWVQM